MGVIAQDVEKVFPDLVTTDERGREQAEHAALIALRIEAVEDRRLTALGSRLDATPPTS